MIASGQLTLPDGVDPSDVTHVQFGTPPKPASGQMAIPACLLNPDYAQALDDEGGIRAFNERVQASGVLDTSLLPPPVAYVHCGRECPRCDELFGVTGNATVS